MLNHVELRSSFREVRFIWTFFFVYLSLLSCNSSSSEESVILCLHRNTTTSQPEPLLLLPSIPQWKVSHRRTLSPNPLLFHKSLLEHVYDTEQHHWPSSTCCPLPSLPRHTGSARWTRLHSALSNSCAASLCLSVKCLKAILVDQMSVQACSPFSKVSVAAALLALRDFCWQAWW